MIDPKERARDSVKRAVRLGELTKATTCDHCGGPPTYRGLHGHHHRGYEDEHVLDVIWLCVSCHSKIHNGWHDRATRKPQPDRPHEQWVKQGRDAQLSMTPEERSEARRRSWETRRARYGESGMRNR